MSEAEMSSGDGGEVTQPGGEEASSASPPSSEATPPAPPSGRQTAPTSRKIRVVDNGREEEIDGNTLLERLIAIHGEDGIKAIGSLSTATRRKLSELGATKKQIEEALADLDDPRKVFRLVERKHGREAARRAVEEWYAADVEERNLDPKTREERKRLSSIEERERKIAEWERQQEERRVAERAAQLQPQLGKMFDAALGRSGVTDIDPLMRRDMAKIVEDEIEAARKAGERITDDDFRMIVDDAARAVARQYGEESLGRFRKAPAEKRREVLKAELAAMDPKDLRELLGEEGVRRFRRADAEAVRRGQAKAAPLAPQPKPKPSGEAPRERKHIDEWLKERW